MKTEALKVQNLSVRFGDFTAVNDISFNVGKGEIFGFLGANGAGKTTTIRVLCGLIPPTEGEIFINQVRLFDQPLELKRKIGYMSQKFTLWDDLSIEENLQFASELHKMSLSGYQHSRDQLLELISFQSSTKTLVKDLPGGLKQQVSLVASLLHHPDMIFLDEPTAGVTPANRHYFWNLIRKVTAQGKTVFVTTHYMDEAEQCDRIALMRAGEIIALDSPAALKTMAFPQGLWELERKTPERSEEELVQVLKKLKAQGVLSMFKAHGLRYHAEVINLNQWQEVEKREDSLFHVQKIAPSLEDVFIRMVEGNL